MRELQIYFSVAIRGGVNFAEVKARIEFLETIGHVLTKHMGSAKSVDLGLESDEAIHAHDQRLLEASQVFIADLSSPSTGAGFMTARAVMKKIPALCLYRDGQKPSAMIAGCPEISTRFHGSEAEFKQRVREFLLAHEGALASFRSRAVRIFLAGPPGSGKGTLGKRLALETGAAHVSTGDLLRDLVARRDGDPRAATIARFMQAGQLVPAEIMADIVVSRLREPDCRLFGFILDGYPPSRDDLLNLTRLGIAPDLVFYLECSDATAAARQVSRGARSTDTAEKARERIAVFHRAEAGFSALASSWFPDSVVVRVDAEQPPEAVETFAREVLGNMLGSAERERSFFPLLPYRAEDVRSSRVHFHVDAPNVEVLRDIARRIYARDELAQGQLKIYPIASLHLGPQAARLPIYQQLPNFHAIEGADTEAFITGRLGDGDSALMKIVLEATRAQGGMAEMEEYVGEWTLKPDGSVVADAIHAPLAIDEGAFDDFRQHLCREIPRLELHLGFNVPKEEGKALPLSLRELMDACAAGGLDNGGWFIFKNEQHWAYRSNEFSFDEVEVATPRLLAQAKTLRTILGARGITGDISFSLELVHGIWTM